MMQLGWRASSWVRLTSAFVAYVLVTSSFAPAASAAFTRHSPPQNAFDAEATETESSPPRLETQHLLPVPLLPAAIELDATSTGQVDGDPNVLLDGSLHGVRSRDGAPARFKVSFHGPRVIEQIVARGAGKLAAYLARNGKLEQIADWQDLPLSAGVLRRFANAAPEPTTELVIEWTPEGEAPLESLSFWTVETPFRALPSGTMAERLHAGDPPGAVSFTPSGQNGSTFAIQLPEAVRYASEAYLTYRLDRARHFSEVARTINGKSSLRGRRVGAARASNLRSLQVEPLSTALLQTGRNEIAFELPNGASVSDVRLVLLASARTHELMLPNGALRSQLALGTSSRPHELVLHVARRGKGKLTVGTDAAQKPFALALEKLSVGWNRVPLDEHLGDAGAIWLEREAKRDSSAWITSAFVTTSPAATPSPRLLLATAQGGQCLASSVLVRGTATTPVARVTADEKPLEVAPDGTFAVTLPSTTNREITIEAELQNGQRVATLAPVRPCGAAAAGEQHDAGAPYAPWVRASEGAVLEFGGARLEIPKGALSRDQRISIRTLQKEDLERLESDKVNVTSRGGGYRFGPHGLKFEKPVLLTLPYEGGALPPGARESEVYGFYYDEPQSRWAPIGRAAQAASGELVSVTDHFTDYIAAAISAPDAPGPKHFNPNEMKGIELGSPSAGIPLIDPPQPSAFGAASVSHPIEVPPGRNGVQPQLALTYSSERGNGWLGMGWDIGLSSIEIDTRFGVPRYDRSDDNSLTDNERYLLDGEQIVPVTADDLRARGLSELVSSRAGAQQYLRRREGQFERIERVGTGPYQWVVTNKQGVQFVYGESAGARLVDPQEKNSSGSVVPHEERKRVFRWLLERVVDPFQNEMRISYTRDEGCLSAVQNLATSSPCGENFTSLYPREITYTHHPSARAGYRVLFELGNQARSDIILDGKPGFIEATRYRLAGVSVGYRTSDTGAYSTIRRYALKYRVGDFDKSLLESFALQGPGDIPAGDADRRNELLEQQHFVAHNFAYHSAPRTATGDYNIFADPENMSQPRPPIVWGTDRGDDGLSRVDTKSSGFNASVGVGFGPLKATVGGGASDGTDRVRLVGTELHGDGLPELLASSGSARRNLLVLPTASLGDFFSGLDLDRGRTGGFTAFTAAGVTSDSLGKSDRDGWSVEGGIGIGPVSAGAAYSRSTTQDESAMADMNGDGFVDLVRVSDEGAVFVKLNDRTGNFSGEVRWGLSSTLNLSDINYSAKNRLGAAADQFHLVDPVVRWTAPFNGPVKVVAPIQKRKIGGNGLRATIYRNQQLIWSRNISASDTSLCVPSGADGCSQDGITINSIAPGDQLFFKTSAVITASAEPGLDDAEGDDVTWLPKISYTSGDPNAIEPYGAPTFDYDLARDFRVSGLPARAWTASAKGTVQISGFINKLATADDLLVRIRHQSQSGLLKRDYELPLSSLATGVFSAGSFSPSANTINVEARDRLLFEILSDVPFDPNGAAWIPNIKYATYSRYDSQTDTLIEGPVVCQPAPEGGCLGYVIGGDPSPNTLIPTGVIEQATVASASTYRFLPHPPYSVTPGGRSATVSVNFTGYTPAELSQAVLVIQSANELVAKAFPNSSGEASLSVDLPSGRNYFATAIALGTQSGSIVVGSLSEGVSLNLRYLDPAAHPSSGNPTTPFAGGYHGFDFGDFNGNRDFANETPSFPNLKQSGAPFSFGVPSLLPVEGSQALELGWQTRGEGFITPTRWRPARASGIVPGAKGGKIKYVRVADTWNADLKIGVSVLSGAYNWGETTTELDLFDVNGDQLPDSVSLDGVRYNRGQEQGFGPREPVGMGFPDRDHVRFVDHRTARIGISLGKLMGDDGTQLKNETDTKGETKQFISTQFEAGRNYGFSATLVDFADVNGDGLMDQVLREGADFKVRLGMGYRYGEPITWQIGGWSGFGGHSAGDDLNGLISEFLDIFEDRLPNLVRVQDDSANNLGQGGGVSGVSGGYGMSYTVTRTLVDLTDMNGDGLADAIMKLPHENFMRVRLNLGARFGNEQRWPVSRWPDALVSPPINAFQKLGSPDALEFRRNESENINVGFEVCFFLCVGVSGYHSWGHGNSTLQLQDIDGDGLTDHVFKKHGDSKVYAKLNQFGKSNLLVRVDRPLGGSFELDYRRRGNHVDAAAGIDMPKAQYVLAATRVADGRGNRYTDTHAYGHDGRFDRDERESYGFRNLITTHVDDGTQLALQYRNDSYYHRGLVARSTERESAAPSAFVHRDSEIRYREAAGQPLRTGIFFPAEQERITTTTEKADTASSVPSGESYPGATKQNREVRDFDAYGDLRTLTLLGEQDDAADDLTYTFEYQRSAAPYFSRANLARAVGAGSSTPLRERRAHYDTRAAFDSITEVIYGGRDAAGTLYSGREATTSYRYTSEGNLDGLTDPNGYTLSFGYDSTLKQYRTSTSDSFGYVSQSVPDYRYGAVAAVTDVNGHTSLFEFDDYARMRSVLDARGAAAGRNTIEFQYSEQASVPQSARPRPAFAKTLHRDELKTAAGIERDPLVTVTFSDGLDRVIQTKKDTERDYVNGQAPVVGMQVSGAVQFDVRGRPTLQGQPSFQTLSVASHLPGSEAETYFVALPNDAPKNPTTTGYDLQGRVTSVRLPDGRTTRTFYSAATLDGRQWFTARVLDAQGNSRTSFFDISENIVAVRERNTVRGTVMPLVTRYTYNPIDELIRVVDPKNNPTQAVYDSRGLLVSLDNRDTGLTEWRYDLVGNPRAKQTARLRARSQFITYEYDFNRLKRTVYPDGAAVAYTYGAATERGPLAYNVAGRLKQETSEAGTRKFRYDALGSVVQESHSFPRIREPHLGNYEYAVDYKYDSFARLLEIQFPGSGRELVTYDYDAGGLVRSARGYNTQINPQHPDEPRETKYFNHIGYDEFGQRVVMVAGNGIQTKYTFDPLSRRLTHISADHRDPLLVQQNRPARPFQRLRYEYDNVDNILHQYNEVPMDPTMNFSVLVGPTSQHNVYDQLYQLTRSEGSYQHRTDWKFEYDLDLYYDEIGNITRKNQSSERLVPNGSGGYRRDYLIREQTYDADYRYESTRPHAPTTLSEQHVAESSRFTRSLSYDESGNQTGWIFRNSERRDVTWNAEDRIREVRKNSQLMSKNLYDGDGTRRVQLHHVAHQEETAYLGQNLTLRDAKYITKHIYAGDTRIASKRDPDWFQYPPTSYYHNDHLGSAHFVTNNNQELVHHVEYFPTGEIWKDETDSRYETGRIYQYNGKELDISTSLYYYGARQYDARLSVWMSPDPILAEYMRGAPNGGVFTPLNLALYTQSWNNPLRYVDPDGRSPWGADALLEPRSPEYTRARAQGAIDTAKGMWNALVRGVGDRIRLGPWNARPGTAGPPTQAEMARADTAATAVEQQASFEDVSALGEVAGTGAVVVAEVLITGNLVEVPQTLTRAERKALQAVADKHNTELHVVGSRAAGRGRNIHNTDLPVGKNPADATRSDIDVRYDSDVEIRTGGELTDDLKNIGGGNLVDARPQLPGGSKEPYIRITPTQ